MGDISLQFQEIVPDMDDTEFMFNEKQSIRDSSRTLKRYGSTCCNSLRNNETLIQHIVEKTDTLQGIALKYGCTVSWGSGQTIPQAVMEVKLQ